MELFPLVCFPQGSPHAASGQGEEVEATWVFGLAKGFP
jgi:hypothetical protein